MVEIPSYNQTLENIEKLKEQEWEEFDGNNLKEYLQRTHLQLTNITGFTPIQYLETQVNFEKDMKFFRERAESDIKNNEVRSEYSYPPICFSTTNMRANLIGNPVFYASNKPIIALLEFIQKWEDKTNYSDQVLLISCWELKKVKRFGIASYVPEELIDINEHAILSKYSNNTFREKANANISDDRINAMRALKDYLSKLFIEDDKRSISAYLGHINIYENIAKPPILIYPSIKSEKGEVNYAVHPNFVDENLSIKHIWKIQVDSIKKNGQEMSIRFQILDEFGYNLNDYIRWTRISKNEKKIKALYKEDFGQELIRPETIKADVDQL